MLLLVPSLFHSFRRNGLLSTSPELCFVVASLRGPKSKTMQPIILLSKLAKKKKHNTNTGNNETRNKQCKRTCSRGAKGKKKVYRGLLAVFFGSPFCLLRFLDGEQLNACTKPNARNERYQLMLICTYISLVTLGPRSIKSLFLIIDSLISIATDKSPPPLLHGVRKGT